VSRGRLAVMDDGATHDEAATYTVEDYVRVESESTIKHEFYDGVIRAMTGGTSEHARIPIEVAFQLKLQLQGKPCGVYSADLRVRIGRMITYPDLSVYCENPAPDSEDELAQLNPRVLFEITSKSSERYDRGKKYQRYQRIPTLREYVIVSHREHAIDVFRRAEDGIWSLAERGVDGQSVSLTSIGCVIDVSAVYRRQTAVLPD
jgi:Uma2 family endonuclease